MSQTVTFSRAYTVVPTYECFNRCSYCNFRTDPGESPWMTVEECRRILQRLQNTGTCEILILSGEVHPHSSKRQIWFQRIYDLCELGLEMGFLPHTNAGPLSFEEMEKLKKVNVSMGLMLEQLTSKLLKTVHRHAPSKLPEVRLQQLEQAGKLRIPFTTGLLLGIGETESDRWETLGAIADIHRSYGHIQEVILQPHCPGSQQSFDGSAFDPRHLPEIIYQARKILPLDITIQIPPNLVQDKEWLIACLSAGARDLGGIGPLDEVNPDYRHIHEDELQQFLELSGWTLVQRLPVYSHLDEWLSGKLLKTVSQWRSYIN